MQFAVLKISGSKLHSIKCGFMQFDFELYAVHAVYVVCGFELVWSMQFKTAVQFYVVLCGPCSFIAKTTNA